MDDLLSEELGSFSEHMTRLEVHLSDENGSKQRINNKRCLLEAYLEGIQPIAVTGLVNTYEFAVNSAIDKLKTFLDTILGRIKSGYRG